MRAAIYTITNLVNGKVYVGSSVDAPRRLYVHRWKLDRGQHDNRMLQRAWLKYGEAAFSFDVLEPVAELDSLLTREQYWIDVFMASKPRYGYNACPVAGSRLGTKQPASVSEKLRSFHTGKPKSAEHRAKIGAANKGRKRTPEQRAKIAENTKRQFADPKARVAMSERMRGRPSGNKGKKMSPEQRAKMQAVYDSRRRDPITGAFLPKCRT